jgi:hypothetical protein
MIKIRIEVSAKKTHISNRKNQAIQGQIRTVAAFSVVGLSSNVLVSDDLAAVVL